MAEKKKAAGEACKRKKGKMAFVVKKWKRNGKDAACLGVLHHVSCAHVTCLTNFAVCLPHPACHSMHGLSTQFAVVSKRLENGKEKQLIQMAGRIEEVEHVSRCVRVE